MLLTAILVASIFVALSLLHVYWAAGGQWGSEAAIPKIPSSGSHENGGQSLTDVYPEMVKAFSPGPAITLVVAGGLALIALLVTLRAGLLGEPIRHWLLQTSIIALAIVMLARAVGDFRLVGFFKTVTNSQFAQMDSFYYSPLCVLLGLGLAIVATS